jgi:OOP family OmpA-OmpF porin
MRGGAPIALALLISACAAPQALLLPGEDGHPVGALAVLGENGRETVLDQPLASARMSRTDTIVHKVAKLKPGYQSLIDTLPPPVKSFTLYFLEGTTTMYPASREVLGLIKAEVAKRPGAEVQVTGHTDTVGNDDDNDRLSLQRANEIEGVLIGEGFAKNQLSAVGRGKRDLAVQTGEGVENSENRRVEVIVR